MGVGGLNEPAEVDSDKSAVSEQELINYYGEGNYLQFLDLERDPNELVNGADQRHAPVIADLKSELNRLVTGAGRRTPFGENVRALGRSGKLSAAVRHQRRGMFDNGTMFTNGQISHSTDNGVFAHDPFSGYLTVATDHVLTFVGSAATDYLSGFIERGEDLHAQAEFAYTRMVQQVLRFRPRSEEAAERADQGLKRARAALDQLWSLHRAPV